MSGMIESRAPWYSSTTLALVAMVAAAAAAVALAYTKHESRKHFMELQKLSRERDALNVEWSQLQLEQGTHAAHSEIEKKAKGPLALRSPEPGDVFLIGDDGDYRVVGLEPAADGARAAAAPVGAEP